MARLHEEMEAAAAALDFERAKCLRDRINLLRGGASPADVEAVDTDGLERQSPGRMGLGTSQQRVQPPPGWTPPPRPDLMTNRSRSRRR